MIRRLDGMPPVRMLDVSGFRLRETVYEGSSVVSTQPHTWATLCLTIDGGYGVDWGRSRLTCGPASLMFQPPGQAYGVHISDAGSHCLSVDIDPAVLARAANTLFDFERLNAARRMPPHWLAFQLHKEFAFEDDLSSESVASIVLTLLADLGDRPGFEARGTPPPWLKRVRDQIDDEFRCHHTLEDLARAAGVHLVHLAREFRRRFGCTVGNYIRQRRIEFACHQLTASRATLSEIALDAGFADQSHFTNTFRQLVGMSPGAFRARFIEHPRRFPV